MFVVVLVEITLPVNGLCFLSIDNTVERVGQRREQKPLGLVLLCPLTGVFSAVSVVSFWFDSLLLTNNT